MGLPRRLRRIRRRLWQHGWSSLWQHGWLRQNVWRQQLQHQLLLHFRRQDRQDGDQDGGWPKSDEDARDRQRWNNTGFDGGGARTTRCEQQVAKPSSVEVRGFRNALLLELSLSPASYLPPRLAIFLECATEQSTA